MNVCKDMLQMEKGERKHGGPYHPRYHPPIYLCIFSSIAWSYQLSIMYI